MLIPIPLTEITDNPWQTRHALDPEHIASLAADIQRNGLMQPPNGRLTRNGRPVEIAKLDKAELILLRGNEYPRSHIPLGLQLAIGHNRVAAYRLLNQELPGQYAAIPVQIGEYTDEQMATMAWAENHQRKDLSAVEEAAAISRALADFGWSHRDAANHFGLARPTIVNKLRLLRLSPELQAANHSGQLSERICAELLRVAEIGEILDPSQNNLNTGYGPMPPSDYIQRALSNPELTSNDVRAYIKQLTEQVGREIPTIIAETKLGVEGVQVKQQLCAGCAHRINKSCFSRPCLDEKKQSYGELIAQSVSAALNLPYSANDADFKTPRTYEGSKRLAELYSHGSCEHVVVGWADYGWGARPRCEPLHGHNSNNAYTDPKQGVILGHRGPIKASCTATLPTVIADEQGDTHTLPIHLLERWQKSGKKQIEKITNATTSALADKLDYALNQTAALTGLMALGGWPQWKHGDDPNDSATLINRLLAHMKQRGPLSGYNSQYPYLHYKKAAEILRDAAIDPAACLDPAIHDTRSGILAARAERILLYWHENYPSADERPPVLAEINECRQLFERGGAHTDQYMATLSAWLDIAAADIQQKQLPAK